MTTEDNKRIASVRRQIADLYDSIDRTKPAEIERSMADELDPPQPQWESGQIAWVTDKEAGRHLCVWRNSCRAWCIGGGTGGSRVLYNPIKVEPLRVLADDEVAINVGSSRARATHWRQHAQHIGSTCTTARNACEQIAEAIEKRGSRS